MLDHVNNKVSIVIPVYNKAELTRGCIESILRHRIKASFEIIVVDNASKDWTGEYLKTVNGVRHLRNEQNKGFSIACNQGAGWAKGNLILFLNNDTIVEPGWLDNLIAGMKRNNSNIVGPKLLYPNRKVQYAGCVFGEDSIAYARLYKYPENHPDVNKEADMGSLCGACFLFKTQEFKDLGGFDIRYKNGLEDIDLCNKAKEKGYTITYIPQSTVIHYESQTEGRKLHDRVNMELYLSIWKGKIDKKYMERREFSWVEHRYLCPNCGNLMPILPYNLNMTCGNCKMVPAHQFRDIGPGTYQNL